jgi:hypothetical protein
VSEQKLDAFKSGSKFADGRAHINHPGLLSAKPTAQNDARTAALPRVDSQLPPLLRPDMASEPLQAFTHAPIRTDKRLMILSACMKCGLSKLVSVQDGSLDKWEAGHKCKDQSQSSIPSSPEYSAPTHGENEN